MTGWRLVYDSYEPAREGHREALCALGNGYFVTRGAAPDRGADGVHYPGTYVAGAYNRVVSRIARRDVENEDLVNLPNWLVLRIRIDDGEWLSPDQIELLSYRQELDVREGLLRRRLRLRDAGGRITRWDERRLVSMADRHLAAVALDLTAENWAGRLTVHAAIDGTVINGGVARYRGLRSRHLETMATGEQDGRSTFLQTRFNQARIEVAEVVRTRLWLNHEPVDPPRRTERSADAIAQEISLELQAGDAVSVEKVLALFTSRDRAISEAGLAARDSAGRAPRFADLLADHRLAWRQLWDQCDIGLDTAFDHEVITKLRVNIFHLLQTVSHHTIDLDVGVPPRGWHGEAYRGHIFWDELFILPYLNFRLPALSRALLMYRVRRLSAARRAAQHAGYRGAQFTRQSGRSGREESPELHLQTRSRRWVPDDTHRQRHINAAIAYNVWSYYQITDDHEFLYFYGAELLLEIARFWASIATYDAARDRFDIKGVMGPDEFHTAYPDADPDSSGGLDNNAYTNVMAAWVMIRAQDTLDALPHDRRRQLCERIGISPDEIAQWDEISRKLEIPFHDDGIISQFEGYGRLQEFDWAAAREKYGDIHRLDRILEAEGDSPNRYKASKQADVLMLFYLFSADELAQLFERLGYPFERDMIPRNIDYYLERTSHGSTLSWMVHSWVLARATRPGSWDMFCEAVDADFSDLQGGTTAEGIHLGAMAGSIDILQRCYTGIEPRAGVLHFNPSLPEQLDRLSMRIRYRRQILDVEVEREVLRITSRRFTAAPITVAYRGQFREMSPGDSYSFRLIHPPRAGATCAPRRTLAETPA